MAKDRNDNPEDGIRESANRPPELPPRSRPSRDEGSRHSHHQDDDYDDPRPRRRYRDDDPPRDAGALTSLIPYRNSLALSAYYCGVFSLIPCLGVVLGIISIILGWLGINFANKNPQAKGKGHAVAGIVLGSVSVLYHLGVIIFIVAVAISSKR